jgi:hypothetical protein
MKNLTEAVGEICKLLGEGYGIVITAQKNPQTINDKFVENWAAKVKAFIERK